MRTCLDRLIAEPHVAGPRLKSESEYLAQRLEVCRLVGKYPMMHSSMQAQFKVL